jgi:hypothetical protein
MNVYCPEEQSASTIRTGSIVLDRDNGTASVEGQTVRLTVRNMRFWNCSGFGRALP